MFIKLKCHTIKSSCLIIWLTPPSFMVSSLWRSQKWFMAIACILTYFIINLDVDKIVNLWWNHFIQSLGSVMLVFIHMVWSKSKDILHQMIKMPLKEIYRWQIFQLWNFILIHCNFRWYFEYHNSENHNLLITKYKLPMVPCTWRILLFSKSKPILITFVSWWIL